MDGLAKLQANNLARQGRYGDSELLHVSPTEVAGLDVLARSMGFGGLTTNPDTGIKEAFLFTPFLAPLIASGLGTGAAAGAGAGLMSGALGTGLIAGGLGTAEAAARGMDNPLQQGLMAGLTAGGMSALGNAASSAAQAAQPAAQAAQAAQLPSIAQQVPQTAGLGLQTTPAMGFDPASAFSLGQGAGGQTGLSMSAGQGGMGITPESSFGQFGSAALPTPPEIPVAPSFTENLMGAPGRMMQTANTLMDSPEAMSTFIRDPRTMMGGASALTGMMGSAGLREQSAMRDEEKSEERKRQRKYDDARNRILANYAAVGRSAPWMAAKGGLVPGYQMGGEVANPRFLRGEGDGMSDGIPALIDGEQPAALADGEFVVPADVVSALGNGSSEAGARRLHEMMQRVRKARTGTPEQAPEIDANGMMPV